MNDDTQQLLKTLARKASRKLDAQRAEGSSSSWGLGMMGVIGWSIAIPTVGGALLGAWLDKHHPGSHSWILALLVAGLILGCANAAHWMFSQTETPHMNRPRDS